MGETVGVVDGVIRARCSRFACCVCRTKTGWPHQPWCELGEEACPGCEDCRYFDRTKARCMHPACKRRGAFVYGKA